MLDIVGRPVSTSNREDTRSIIVPSHEVILGLGGSVDAQDNIYILWIEDVPNEGLIPFIGSWQEELLYFPKPSVG